MRHAASHTTCTPCGLSRDAALAYVEPAIKKKKRADARNSNLNGGNVDVNILTQNSWQSPPGANASGKKRKQGDEV